MWPMWAVWPLTGHVGDGRIPFCLGDFAIAIGIDMGKQACAAPITCAHFLKGKGAVAIAVFMGDQPLDPASPLLRGGGG